jgi:hypothetical protein
MIILIVITTLSAGAAGECFLLSNGESIFWGDYSNGRLKLNPFFLRNGEQLKGSWPVYRKSTGEVIFESNGQNGPEIISIDINSDEMAFKYEGTGSFSALSKDGNLLAFVNDRQKVIVKDLSSNKFILEFDTDMSIWKRPVWLEDSVLVYSDRNSNLNAYSFLSGDNIEIEIDGYYPIGSVADSLFLTDSMAKLISKYDKNGEIIEFYHRHLSVGPSLFQLKDSNEILYSRQETIRLLFLDEKQSLFKMSLETGRDSLVSEGFALFGAANITLNEQARCR